MKKLDGLFLALVFLIFGFLQYNDPDGIFWMLVYGAAAVLSFLSYQKKIPRLLLLITAGVFILGAVYLWPPDYQGLSLKDGYTTAIEEARESLGLGICAAGMLWLVLRAKKN